MTRGIRVSVRPATPQGRLHPRYVTGAQVLALESEAARSWSYGVQVNGAIVFDLDADRVLANVDLHKVRWRRDLPDTPLMSSPPGDIVFAPDAVATQSFSLSLRVRSDSNLRLVRIELGTAAADRFVALSDACVAMLAGEELAGFLVKLPRRS